MKKLFIVLLITIFTGKIFSQNIGIGTNTPHASAKLDINDNSKGLLIPRMTAAERDAIAAPANGLLVYTTTDSSFYYYHNGWYKLPSAGEIWRVNGNSNTNPAINFIGTTDNTAFTIRINNQPSGKIDSSSSNTFLGYQSGIVSTGKFNTAVGFQTLLTNTIGIDNTAVGNQALLVNSTGFGNTATGDWALLDNTTGYYNTAFGKNAMIRNITGIENTSIGLAALASNKVGNANTAAGFLSLYLDTSGTGNTAAGKYSLYNNLSGNYNTATGYNAGFTNTIGSNNTFIGYNADAAVNNLSNAGAIGYEAKVGANNSFVIGGTGANAVNVGIGTITPTERLDVIGNIKATGTITPSDIRFKTNIDNLHNSIDKIMQLQGVTYNWRATEFSNCGFDKTLQIGFIAQDVEKIFPEVVHTGSDGYKGVDYTKLIPVLVEAMKEQQKQIDYLKRQIKKRKP